MRIYRACTETGPAGFGPGCDEMEVHTVLDDEGNEPPADARLVDVDEARAALFFELRVLFPEGTPWRTYKALATMAFQLFPEGE